MGDWIALVDLFENVEHLIRDDIPIQVLSNLPAMLCCRGNDNTELLHHVIRVGFVTHAVCIGHRQVHVLTEVQHLIHLGA